MTGDDLSSMSLEDLRHLDRIALKYRGCRYALLTEDEVIDMILDIEKRTQETLDRCVLIAAGNVIQEELVRIIEQETE